MITMRQTSSKWLILALLPLMIIGCQMGIGAYSATPPSTPQPPPMGQTKVIDGFLEVWYKPCERGPSPFDWVSPLTLTDIRSGSVVYLNSNGTVKTRPKPKYKTEEGRAALEAVLGNGELMKQVVARPACVYPKTIRHRDGWPDPWAINIGVPPIPKVAMGISWPNALESHWVYPGWRGAYCWPMRDGNHECDDTANWKGFGAAEPIPASSDSRIYFTVLGNDGSLGRLMRIQMFPSLEKRATRRPGSVHLGEEVYGLQADVGTSLGEFIMPKGPDGVYMLMVSYEFPQGEVTYGFKVQR